MLGTVRSGDSQAAVQAALAQLRMHFVAAGAEPLDLPHLFAGDMLLDLYGEDLRARAFVFAGAGQNELSLRPDFTVPVATAHGAQGWARTAAYTYHGPVFRRQPEDATRPVEYLQAGIERFGDRDPVAAEIAVLTQMRDGLAALGVRDHQIWIGDLSIIVALLGALDMPEHRRRALQRHLWRPRRFQDLLRRAVAPVPPPPPVARLLETTPADRRAAIDAIGEPIGLRRPEDVLERLSRLATRAADMRMPPGDAALIEQVLAVSGPPEHALRALRRIAGSARVDIGAALDRFDRRIALMDEAGFDPGGITFDAAFGRNLEYYDGFVFEIRAAGGGDHPPLAGGGRYDAMTTRLGAPAPVPAVGGIIRPEAALQAAQELAS
ncbi:MAG: ATP phosphoribosyltransferase regulatory subunit [Pseudomonadota bacterium]